MARIEPLRARVAACLAALGLCTDMTATAGTPSAGDGGEAFVFAGSAAYPPHQWLDEDGTPRGFLIDLQAAIGAAGERPVSHRLMPWSRALAALDNGDVDAVPMFASPRRARRYDFTDPFYYVTHAVFGPEGYPGVGGPEALEGARVAVVKNGYAQSLIAVRHPSARLHPVVDIESAIRAVVADEADFAVLAQPIAARLIAVLELPVAQISRPLWPRAYVFAVRKGDTEALSWLQDNLRQVQVAGRYHEIYGAWRDELEWHPVTWRDSLRQLAWVAAPAVLLLGLALTWNRSLRRRVGERTGALAEELARRQAVEANLRHAASHDPLTDLPNRAEFTHRAEGQLARATAYPDRPVAILALKLADLAHITSAFGYETGEGLVRCFAERLQTLDLPVAGDFGRGYFGLLWVGEWQGEALLARLTAPVEVNELEIDPRLATAAAWRTHALESAEELMRRAETALVRDSDHGGDWTPYDTGMEPDPQDLLLVRDFRRHFPAAAQTVFQPQYHPYSGTYVGAEALFRWAHPELGPVGPARLIPLLDKANLTPRVTRFMLDEAIGMAVTLRRQGHPLRISVNVSASDFVADHLPQRIADRLLSLGGCPGDLCLEITETNLIADPHKAARELQALREMGVSCAIDDFGTGYSSLSYLGHFPLDEVKIDKGFVQKMNTDERHRTIVRSSIALAQELGLRTVAEGAEDQQTVTALLEAGCDCIQGSVYAGPMPGEELTALLAAQRRTAK